MPGILPMKVIRVGSNSQSRIAQACDRCRSKKIRCDGVRPCCSQCANVGFECKTSDKLSRRAFPRGYTESLEDRVRALEAEVRELKELLDEKDEKIDMLSKIHSFSPVSRKNSASMSPCEPTQAKEESVESSNEDMIEVQAAGKGSADTALVGASSTASFIDSFNRKVQESGRPAVDIHLSSILPPLRPSSQSPTLSSPNSGVPPRLLSDQYINIFFQEWAPLLPILHRPTFLRIYEDYLSEPEAAHWHRNKHAIAQLYLIFDIAALSSISRGKQFSSAYEPHWRKAMRTISSEVSLAALQCHILAQMFFLLKGDYSRLARYRATAVSICQQLGLHQSQRYYSLGPMECEMRKRAFWVQYVLDRFAAVMMGRPVLLNETDIGTEYPGDIDDENITEKGFLPALPNELTKISAALALIDATRILTKALDRLYPAAASYSFAVSKAHALSEELEKWCRNLPSHLRLTFCKDKPSTGIISDRSPLLSLVYFHIRTIIHRPIVCFGSGNHAAASLIAIADSGKHIVQILDLLDERSMNFAFPLNKVEILVSAGLALLWQRLDLPAESKIVQDNRKSFGLLFEVFKRYSMDSATSFVGVLQCLAIPSDGTNPRPHTAQTPIQDLRLRTTMSAPSTMKNKSAMKQIQAFAARFTNFGSKLQKPSPDPTIRRPAGAMTASENDQSSPQDRSYSRLSISSAQSEPCFAIAPPYTSPTLSRSSNSPKSAVNLDFFPMARQNSMMMSPPAATPQKGMEDPVFTDVAWESILASMDSGNTNIFNGIYGGSLDGETPFAQPLSDPGYVDSMATPIPTWPSEIWSADAINVLQNKAPVPQSLLSFSDESLTSGGDDFSAHSGSSVPPQEVVADGFVGGIAVPHDFEAY